ncbi:MAG: metal ABC transporter permease [candidate division Zixibacteria bacterium]|nr:metal ABC transporter permease [candidate division Zixibacteria bacterium]
MIEFIEAVSIYSFLQYALLAGMLAGISCGIVGSYVVTRRITYIAGAIAHSVLGGMGAAYYLSVVYEWPGLRPVHGAVVAALLSAILIGWVTLRAREREDTAIGAIWAIGMAVGIIFISQTPGYNQELMGYLFGNILMISPFDLWLMLALDLLLVVTTIVFYNRFLAVCFDEEFARVRGVRVELYYILLLCLIALTVVILVAVVGVVMVIALLTLPAAVAGYFSRTLRQLMAVAIGGSIFFTTSGLAISYQFNLPAGATIIIVAGVVYLVIALGSRLFVAVRHNSIRERKAEG